MKVWLDHIRPCPDGYLHARSVNEAIKLLEEHDLTSRRRGHTSIAPDVYRAPPTARTSDV
jgi:hypothetical protein